MVITWITFHCSKLSRYRNLSRSNRPTFHTQSLSVRVCDIIFHSLRLGITTFDNYVCLRVRLLVIPSWHHMTFQPVDTIKRPTVTFLHIQGSTLDDFWMIFVIKYVLYHFIYVLLKKRNQTSHQSGALRTDSDSDSFSRQAHSHPPPLLVAPGVWAHWISDESVIIAIWRGILWQRLPRVKSY